MAAWVVGCQGTSPTMTWRNAKGDVDNPPPPLVEAGHAHLAAPEAREFIDSEGPQGCASQCKSSVSFCSMAEQTVVRKSGSSLP